MGACIPQGSNVEPAPCSVSYGFYHQGVIELLVAIDDVPVPDIIFHGGMLVKKCKAGDGPAVINLLDYDVFGRFEVVV